MRTRIARSFERFLEWNPDRGGLDAALAVAGVDLADQADLRHLAGGSAGVELGGDARVEIPRLRPILVVLAARAAGAGTVESEVQYAAELLHISLTVHDLALGRRRSRRRRLARRIARRSFDWLSANHLTLRALELGRQGGPEVVGELVDTLRCFSDAHGLAQELQGSALPEFEDWSAHADAHTGALLSFCCRAGALVAARSGPYSVALGDYGRHLGRLWHVAEDVSGLVHGSSGVHLLERALAGRPMLPVIKAAEHRASIRALWDQLELEPSEALAASIVAEVGEAGGLAAAREVILQESWAGRSALLALPESRYRSALERLIDALAQAAIRGKRAAD
jgi:geranylgeranyl pyrophosphate synthase